MPSPSRQHRLEAKAQATAPRDARPLRDLSHGGAALRLRGSATAVSSSHHCQPPPGSSPPSAFAGRARRPGSKRQSSHCMREQRAPCPGACVGIMQPAAWITSRRHARAGGRGRSCRLIRPCCCGWTRLSCRVRASPSLTAPLSDARAVDTLAPGLTLALRRVTITERSSSWTLGRMHEYLTAQRGLMHLKDLHHGHRAPRGARGRRARSGDHGHGARHPGGESARFATRLRHPRLLILKKSARTAQGSS